jgi:hypothetical protein
MSENSAHQRVNVVWFASYPSRRSRPDEHRDAFYLIRALKHAPHKACGDAYRLNRQCRLDTKNIKQVLEWFGTLAALVIRFQYPYSPVILVPVPDSDCVPTSFQAPRTLRLAEAIALSTRTTVVIADSLRWKHQQPPCHRGGNRDPDRLFRELELTRMPPSGTIVLIDDVMTTGAHLLASAARLRSAGFHCEDAICVARTEACGERPTFAIRQTTILGAMPMFSPSWSKGAV